MDVREKLVELIAQKVCETWSGTCDQWLPHDCGKCYANDCHISEIADHLIRNGVTVQEWISVLDMLPEESGMYIVTANDGHAQRVSFVQWQKKNRMWNLTGARSYWRVTHWMPIPVPPKGE